MIWKSCSYCKILTYWTSKWTTFPSTSRCLAHSMGIWDWRKALHPTAWRHIPGLQRQCTGQFQGQQGSLFSWTPSVQRLLQSSELPVVQQWIITTIRNVQRITTEDWFFFFGWNLLNYCAKNKERQTRLIVKSSTTITPFLQIASKLLQCKFIEFGDEIRTRVQQAKGTNEAKKPSWAPSRSWDRQEAAASGWMPQSKHLPLRRRPPPVPRCLPR